MTADELRQRFPHASAQFIRDNASDAKPAHRPARRLPPPVVERRDPPEPLARNQAEARSATRTLVRVTSHRVRLLDEDNLCEKFLVDGLRYAGIIDSDAPDRCRIITTQKKVARFVDEFTEIVIEREAK